MFGFGDVWVALAYILCLLSTLLCIGYGVVFWNKDDEVLPPEKVTKADIEFEESL
jgi:hypothetical protein